MPRATRDGSSRVILLSPSTTVSKSVSGSASDITAGAEVIVTGSANSYGSYSATQVQIRPAGTASPAR